MSGIEAPTLCSAVRDTEINVVRQHLDTLANLRYRTGLSVVEGDRYRELCRSERALLHSDGSSGHIPDWLSHMSTAPSASISFMHCATQ
jgi:hypothetical protein